MAQLKPDRGSVSTAPLGEVRQVVARIILVAFVMTFMAARVLVFLIVSRRIPDLFLHVGGTHIHHLNYGIFLLSGIGAYLLLMRPQGRLIPVCGPASAEGTGARRIGAAVAMRLRHYRRSRGGAPPPSPLLLISWSLVLPRGSVLQVSPR